MKEILNVFKPEISPIHKVDFSIAVQLKPNNQPAGKLIPAGTLLKGDFLKDPASNVAEIVTTAADNTVTGVLMHDVYLEDASTTDTRVSVGVMIEGVVYEDVMAQANGSTVWPTDGSAITHLHALGIKVYGAKTIGLSR